MNEIERLATVLLNSEWLVNGIMYNLKNEGWIFKFNKRKKALGMCDFKKKTISLSEYFVDSNLDKVELWEDTLKHEIAHAIDYKIRRYSDHSETWKNIARQVGCESETYSDNTLKTPDGKYILKCRNCGIEKNGYRKRKKNVACFQCCTDHNEGKFSEEFILDYILIL